VSLDWNARFVWRVFGRSCVQIAPETVLPKAEPMLYVALVGVSTTVVLTWFDGMGVGGDSAYR
jgi:hypothetical protein